MKKIITPLLLFGSIFFASAQYKSEVKFNVLNTIAIASFEAGYEFFLDDNQSIGAEVHINDRFSYADENDRKEFDTNSVLINYNYYFNPENTGTIFAFPFVKYRFGEHKDEVKGNTNMDSFILGLGIGYKWAWNDKFAIGPYASVARNFNEDVSERFSAIEANAGISVGFRF